jgi:hypothetical protein
MKHIHTFESFLNESQKMTFQELKDKYKDNPYGIGAQSVEFIEGKNGNPNMLVFRHDERSRLNNVEANLKSFGFDKKKMTRSTQDKAYKYRYELNLYESELNEGFMSELDIIRQESKDVKDFIKNALQEYPQLKGEEKFLEEIWNTSQEMGN